MTGSGAGGVLKEGLKKRVPMLVVNVDYANGSLVAFLAANGADVVFIDCEQGDVSIQAIPDLVRAAHLQATPALVRLFSPEPWVIERHLLRGVDGIVVPRLGTVEQVRAVVSEVRHGFPDRAESTSIVIQIETVEAARAIDDILAVEGVDALFIGPVDLAKSMGHGGDYGAPPVAAEIDRLIRRIRDHGRSVGMLVTEATIASVAAKGVNFLYLHTNDFLRVGSQRFQAAKKAAQPGA
ncbi:MAG: aldolase/citrate lyase family protein [Alphaproteobacteria bacterium]